MVALKKSSFVRSEPDRKEAKARCYDCPFAGFIFVCNNLTVPDLDRQLFGLPARHEDSVRAIRKGMPLFLYNYSTRLLHGVFEAASNGGYNLDPYAWENTDLAKMGRSPVSRYPSQVKVRVRALCPPLDEETFRPILDRQEGHKFRLELSQFQVQQLLRLFGAVHSEAEWEFGNELSITDSFQHPVFVQEPESPNCVCKSDMDSCSVSSAGGNNYNEDEWSDESNFDITTARELNSNFSNEFVEEYLNHRTAQLSLGQLQSTYESSFEKQLPKEINTLSYSAALRGGMHTSARENMSSFDYSQVESKGNLKRHPTQKDRSEVLHFTDENSVLNRLQDVDPAVNSDSVNYVQSGRRSALGPKGQDTVNRVVPFQSQAPPVLIGAEKLFYIPAPTLQCQQTGIPNVAVPQRPKWGDPLKLVSSWTGQQAKKHSFSQEKLNRKDVRSNQQPVQLANLQLEQVLVPLCMPRAAPLHEQGCMTPLVSPAFFPHTGAALTDVGTGTDDVHEVCDSVTDVPLNRDGLQGLVQAGSWGLQVPVLLMPSFMPRMAGHPPMPELNVGALHFEILEFAKIARPSVETRLHAEAAIGCVRHGVRAIWPDADVEVFGSFATGLCLRHSDVDLAVIGAPLPVSRATLSVPQASALLIRELSQVLRNYYWCENITVIDTASMPVLKCRCRPADSDSSVEFSSLPPVAIDITIGGMRSSEFEGNHLQKKVGPEGAISKFRKFGSKHTGGAAREYVLQKIVDLPALFPLVILLKSYLHHKGLSDVYSGGLGSFSLTLLLAFYLERVSSHREFSIDGMPVEAPLLPTISSPLTCASEFSEDSDSASSSSSCTSSNTDHDFYGSGEFLVRRAADVADKVLTMWNSSGSPSVGTFLLGFLQTFGFVLDLSTVKIVLKGPEGNGGIISRDSSTRHMALWIDDPLRPGVNVGAGSYAMCHVQGAFREMLQVLTNRQFFPITHERICSDIPDIGLLYYLSSLFEADDY